MPVEEISRYATTPRLLALSAGQVVGWGALYYSFLVAAPKMSADTGWSLASITSLFAGGLVLSALLSIGTGRLLDRSGPRLVVTAGTLVGVVSLLLVSRATSLVQLGAAFVVCGFAQSAVLYNSAFTIITHRYQEERRRALSIVTIAAGLSSTIFAPLVAWMLGVVGWREMIVILALMLAVANIPLYWLSLEARWHAVGTASSHRTHSLATVVRTGRFWRLTIAVAIVACASFAATMTAIPLFTERGMSFELAALGLGLIGAGQLIGRLLFLVVPHARQAWVPLAVVAGASTLTLIPLGLVPGPAWLLIALGIIAGAVRGALTLVQATAVSDRWGTTNYGAINGAFAAPVSISIALAPAIGPIVAERVGSFSVMVLVMAAVTLVGLLLAPST